MTDSCRGPAAFSLHKRLRPMSLPVLVWALGACGSLPAAVHMTYRVERQYFGQVQQMPDVEIWFSDSLLCFVRGKQKILFSWIEGKKTVFSSDGRRCYRCGIDERIAASAPVYSECPIQYRQKYDWRVVQRLPDDTLRNVPCFRLVLDGQDAYSEKQTDVWVARDIPGFLKQFPARRASCRLFSEDGDMDFFDADSVLSNGVVCKQIDVVTPPNPVPDTYVVTTTLIRFEEGDAPEDLFRIPEGIKQVRTLEEL